MSHTNEVVLFVSSVVGNCVGRTVNKASTGRNVEINILAIGGCGGMAP